MLNCFIENCAHLGYPLLNAPILDGRFSPDGLGFSVASYYGSISMYGYGDRDFFTPTPIEQFYWKEFQEFEIEADSYRVVAVEGAIDMHFIPKGPLCSSKKQIYKPILQDQPDYLDFDEQRYYEKFVQVRFPNYPPNDPSLSKQRDIVDSKTMLMMCLCNALKISE